MLSVLEERPQLLLTGMTKKDLLEEMSVSWTSGWGEERLRDGSEGCVLRTVTQPGCRRGASGSFTTLQSPALPQGGSDLIGLGWGPRHALKVPRFLAALFTIAKR